MIEGGVVGLGAAYVDAKIRSSNLHLPSKRSELPLFLDAHPEAELYAGGSIPNILTAFSRLSPALNMRLFSCVGNDNRGKFYQDNTDRRLGKVLVSRRKPTGIWVGIYNNSLVEDLDYYGAAGDINIAEKELGNLRTDVFITDIDAYRTTESLDSIRKVIDTLSQNGLFVLSLSGVEPDQPVDQLLSVTKRGLEVVFGNEAELLKLIPGVGISDGVQAVFPESRLAVITMGREGAVVGFEGEFFSVAANRISRDRIIDSAGAGDAYMGTMLAILSRIKYKDWSKHDILRAAQVASHASALVVQNEQPRLTHHLAQNVLEYEVALG